MIEIVKFTTEEARCARCGLAMGFEADGNVYYCFNEHTCE